MGDIEGVRSQRAKGWVHARWVHAGWVTPRPDLWLTCGGGDSLADPSLRKITPRSLRGPKREAAFPPTPVGSSSAFVYVLFTMWRKWPGPGKMTLNSPPNYCKLHRTKLRLCWVFIKPPPTVTGRSQTATKRAISFYKWLLSMSETLFNRVFLGFFLKCLFNA